MPDDSGAAARADAGQRRHRSGSDAVDRRRSCASGRAKAISASATTAATWSQRLIEHMLNERFGELARKPDAKFLGAGVGGGSLEQRRRRPFAIGAQRPGRQDRRRPDRARRSKRSASREFGFSAVGARPREEVDGRVLRARLQRARQDRERLVRAGIPRATSSNDEPSPGIAYEYELVKQLLPGITLDDVVALAKRCWATTAASMLATAPQKAGVKVPTEPSCRRRSRSGERDAVTPWNDTAADRATLMEHKPAPAASPRAASSPTIGVTVVRFANGVEAWLKPTDFKNDQVLFSLNAQGGASLAPPAGLLRGVARRPPTSSAVGRRRHQGARPAEDARRQARVGVARSSRCRRTASPAARRRPSSRRRCSCSTQEFTAPGDDPEAFALLKRQLDAVGRQPRPQSRSRCSARSWQQVNTSNHYTVAAADRRARRRARPREDARVLPRALRERRRLHVLHGRRVQGRRGAAAAGAVRRLAAVDRHADVARSRTSASRFPRGIEAGQRSKKGASRASQTVISFFADPSIDPMEQENVVAATTCSTSRCATSCARTRPDLHRVGRPVAAAAAAGRRPRRGQLRRRAGEHRRDDRARAAGNEAAAGRGARRRSDDAREGSGAARLRDRAEAERLLAAASHVRADAAARTRR